MMEFVCIGVPYWLGKKEEYTGSVEMIQQSGIADKLNAPWIELEPDFDAVDEPVVAVNIALAQAIKDNADRFPIIFAGDCTSCVGAMKGLESHEPDILWYDAHGDFNTTETSPSGFLGGMPLAAMVGRDNQWFVEGVGLSTIAESKVIITDARDIDPEEEINLRNSDITWYDTLASLKSHVWTQQPMYIHFDCDVLHLDDLPNVVYPAKGGSHMPEVQYNLQSVIAQANPVGILFSLWHAQMEGADLARDNTLKLVDTMVETLSKK